MLNVKYLIELRNGNSDDREFYISFLVELREICKNSKINFNLKALNKLIEDYEL